MTAVALIAVAGVTQAHAQSMTTVEPEGAYFGMGLGVNGISKGDATIAARTPSAVKFKFHDGWAASLSAGYKWTPGLRGELELRYRTNGVKNLNSNAFPLSGRPDDLSLMANLLYDFKTGTRFTPYIGVGVGGSMVWWRKFANASSTRIVHAAGGTKLAFQGIAGVAYAVTPDWQVTFDGRYKGSSGHTFKGVQAVDTVSGFKLRDTTLMLGLRYDFGA